MDANSSQTHTHETLLQHRELEPYPMTEAYYRTPLTQLQRVGVRFMIERETTSIYGQCGGLICDEIGLGKTLQSLATIAERLHANEHNTGVTEKTLVVAPSSVLLEWKAQADKHLMPNVLRIHVYQGADRELPDMTRYDVLLTSYGIVQREYEHDMIIDKNGLFTHWMTPNGNASPFHAVFDRIILDEAHTIRNRTSATHQSVCALNGEIHWVLTATPIWNSVTDIFALCKFLNAHPLCIAQVFDAKITSKIMSPEHNSVAYLREFLRPIELRRPREVLELPPLTETTITVTLSESERLFYDALKSYSVSTITRLFQMEKWLKRTGFARVHTNMALMARQRILSTLLRMRQACVHPQLAINGFNQFRTLPLNSAQESLLMTTPLLLQEAADRLRQLEMSRDSDDMSKEECGVCLTETPTDCLIPCGHTFCGTCCATICAMNAAATCPICRHQIMAHKPIEMAVREHSRGGENIGDDEDDDANAADTLQIQREWDTSSKIDAVMTSLMGHLAADSTAKALIFSQWLGALTTVCNELRKRNIKYLRLDGSVTSQKRRHEYHTRFNTDPTIVVLVCSLTCSSVGINLQGANLVYIMDPWWTDAKERQAGGRAHRIGQTRPVTLYHVIVSRTIEEGVVDLQRRKRELVDMNDGRRNPAVHWAEDVRRLMTFL
jgi:SNF2 family DNA or RNA helicase